MAFEIPVLLWGTQVAHVDLSSSQFLGVYVNGTSGIDVQVTQGSPIVGVLQNNPKAAQPCVIMTLGITKMIAGASNIAPGTLLMVDGAGKAIAQTGSNSAIGRLVDSVASTTGQLCTVQLIPN